LGGRSGWPCSGRGQLGRPATSSVVSPVHMPTITEHRPKVIQRRDGRFEIRCPQCERIRSEPRPIGIGLPVTNRAEAESIARNHAGRAA